MEQHNDSEKIVTSMPKVSFGCMNNTNLVNQLSDARKEFSFDGTVYGIRTMPDTCTSLSLNVSDDKNITVWSSKKITGFDMAVMDAVSTLYEHDCMAFTPAMVARILIGGNGTETIHKKQLEEVKESLDKLMCVAATIDLTEEYVAREMLHPGDKAEKTGHLLQMTRVNVRFARHKEEYCGYKLFEEPLLYTYAKRIGQVISYHVSLLDTKKNNTKETILIKRYLLMRIEAMKNENNNIVSNRVIYERWDRDKKEMAGMLTYLGYDKNKYSNWRKKKNTIHETVCEILDSFVEKGYIDGYRAIVEERRRINGVEIMQDTGFLY